jgi:hypothetical protein
MGNMPGSQREFTMVVVQAVVLLRSRSSRLGPPVQASQPRNHFRVRAAAVGQDRVLFNVLNVSRRVTVRLMHHPLVYE